MKATTINEAEEFVTLVNNLIEMFCNKNPDEFTFDDASIGYDPETLEITAANGDDIEDVLKWVNVCIMPATVVGIIADKKIN